MLLLLRRKRSRQKRGVGEKGEGVREEVGGWVWVFVGAGGMGGMGGMEMLVVGFRGVGDGEWRMEDGYLFCPFPRAFFKGSTVRFAVSKPPFRKQQTRMQQKCKGTPMLNISSVATD